MRRLALFLAILLAACGDDPSAGSKASAHLRGAVAVADTVQNVRVEGFSILVFDRTSAGIDTVGHVWASADGSFSVDLVAERAGVYPVALLYEGEPLRLDEIVVAEGDSITVQYAYPIVTRLIRFRSRENDAWMAYRNALALRDQAFREAVSQPDVMARMEQASVLTSNILWSLREGHPGTVAQEVAAAESIALLDGWNDSLLVARAAEITPEHAGYLTAARAGRRAEARLRGQRSAIRFLEAYRDRDGVRPEDQASIQAEIVTARLDSLQADAATVAARTLSERYPDSPWATWAERAQYEATTLMPGQVAPAFTVRSDQGRTVSLDSLRGRVVVLEFFAPGNEAYQQQLETRLALEQALAAEPITFVSVSLDADSLMTRAFFSQVPLRGPRIAMPEGFESPLARQFNVQALPMRYLIDPEGRIRAKYVGPLMPQLTQDLLTLLGLTPSA